jgi:septum formation protein
MQDSVYLASESPRRKALLAQLGIPCCVLPASIDESRRPGEPPDRFVLRLAAEKAAASQARLDDPTALLIAADTAVVVDREVLGKPRSEDECITMLERLSGRSHEVVTGIAVMGPGRTEAALSRSRVTFRPLAPGEASAYWATGEPADKAGGYAIQGLAAAFIESLHGSYSGVMGLPLFETARALESFGYRVFGPAGAGDRIRG